MKKSNLQVYNSFENIENVFFNVNPLEKLARKLTSGKFKITGIDKKDPFVGTIGYCLEDQIFFNQPKNIKEKVENFYGAKKDDYLITVSQNGRNISVSIIKNYLKNLLN
ncbi:MAG: hypothetical protein KC516_04170 [Nanoarchaeota archaeon]|nr:hypothetical protein [Nanoarchaeota archaeon]